MKLIWNGHSCFTLATEAGTLVIDPYEDGSVPGLSPLHLEADAVYCSHEHRDHGNRAAVALSGKPCAVEVEELATWHDEVQGAKRGPNTMRIFSAEGLRVAHLGDLGCGLTPEQAEALSGLDALLIPVGGFYTIDAGHRDEQSVQTGGAVRRPSGGGPPELHSGEGLRLRLPGPKRRREIHHHEYDDRLSRPH